jgi:MarR family 2-MHQ and catechol resistance regulon transcriptional repressor
MNKSTQSKQDSTLVEKVLEQMRPCLSHSEPPLASALLCHIYLLNSVLERMGNRCAETHNLTMPQWMALGCIGNGGEQGITHSELGSRLMLSKAPITGVVDRLERDGYVHRKVDGKDRRISRVVITPSGESKWTEVRHAVHECAVECCSALSDDEQQQILGLLARLLESASKSDPILATIRQPHRATVSPN